MRVIERRILSAIDNKESRGLSNRDRVEYMADIGCVNVYLHGHNIANVYDNRVVVDSCNWRTNTTKSRLNAILWEYCATGIYQKDFIWYVNGHINAMFSGKKPVYFEDGMSFPRRSKYYDGDKWVIGKSLTEYSKGKKTISHFHDIKTT